jgi:hypothetical protein
MNYEIDKQYELLCAKFGKNISAVDKDQKLSSEANTYASQAKSIFDLIVKKLNRVLVKAGIVKDKNKAEEIVANIYQESKADNNDNAEKQETETEKQKEVKEDM